MANKIDIVCPSCNTVCTPLTILCKNCNGRVAEYIAMRRRVDELEKESGLLTEAGNWMDAVRAFSILLEYHPQHPRYLKGLISGCIGIGQIEYAQNIVRELALRFNNDKEIMTLRQRIDDLMKQKEGYDGSSQI